MDLAVLVDEAAKADSEAKDALDDVNKALQKDIDKIDADTSLDPQTKRLAVDAYLRPEIGIPEASFPSTSTMAVETFRAEVLERSDALQVELKDLVDAFREVRLRFESGRARPVPKVRSLARQKDLAPLVQMDGRWFYRDSYEPAALRAEYGEDFMAGEMAISAAERARGQGYAAGSGVGAQVALTSPGLPGIAPVAR